MQVTRQHVVEILRTAGLPEAADQAERSLPVQGAALAAPSGGRMGFTRAAPSEEEIELGRAADFLGRYGITKDALISRMGGSP
jgi:hypothetical protein